MDQLLYSYITLFNLHGIFVSEYRNHRQNKMNYLMLQKY